MNLQQYLEQREKYKPFAKNFNEWDLNTERSSIVMGAWLAIGFFFNGPPELIWILSPSILLLLKKYIINPSIEFKKTQSEKVFFEKVLQPIIDQSPRHFDDCVEID